MNNLEKYLDQVIEQRPVVYDTPPEPAPVEPPKVTQSLLRRWYIIVFVFLVIAGAGAPAVWYLVKPRYVVTGAVEVRPVVESVITGETVRGEFSDYSSYLNTQSAKIVSGDVLDRVAHDLAAKNLAFFSATPGDPLSRLERKLGISRPRKDPAAILKTAIADEIISVGPFQKSELIGVTMRGTNLDEARKIVNAFLTNFQSVYGLDAQGRTNQRLQKLIEEEDGLRRKINEQQKIILDLANENSTTALDKRQEMEMRRQETLWSELIRIQAQRISLEANIAVLEQAGDSNTPPEQRMAARTQFINANSMVAELTRSVVETKRDLILAEKAMASGNPELARRRDVLAGFEQALEEKRAEVEKEFEEVMADQQKADKQQQLARLQTQLEQIKNQEKVLSGTLEEQSAETQKVGRASVELQDRQFKLEIDKQALEQVARRRKSLEMETPGGDSRIRIAYYAELVRIEDKRVKYSAALIVIALGCGVALAFLRDRVDKTLLTPGDVTRQLGLPVIGTTTNSRTLKPAAFAEQIAGDYQMIRTNLGLLGNGGMPKRLTVSSAGMREGKTTFAVNLATSLAKSGRKVLLIDGDMRKPDIGFMLNIGNGTGGLQDVLLGEDPRGLIAVVPSSGLHVLAANPRHLADTYELLTSTMAAEQIERLSREYEHIIIDSPPALAFPDALVWAKLSDAVILVSFAGQTRGPELREAKERFAHIKARILGTILSNVAVDQSMYRYGYSYRARGGHSARAGRKPRKLLLSTPNDGNSAATKA
jgi:succinoglycan biosynthesis transport protein ExoP